MDDHCHKLYFLLQMRETLEVRLAEAQYVIRSAELEKIEKENAAMKALTELELIMEKVLEESKILNQQAEENAKVKCLCLFLIRTSLVRWNEIGMGIRMG